MVLWLYSLAHHLRRWVDHLVVALHILVALANLRKEIALVLLIGCLLGLHLHLLLLLADKPCVGHVVVSLGLELSVLVWRLHEVG